LISWPERDSSLRWYCPPPCCQFLGGQAEFPHPTQLFPFDSAGKTRCVWPIFAHVDAHGKTTRMALPAAQHLDKHRTYHPIFTATFRYLSNSVMAKTIPRDSVGLLNGKACRAIQFGPDRLHPPRAPRPHTAAPHLFARHLLPGHGGTRWCHHLLRRGTLTTPCTTTYLPYLCYASSTVFCVQRRPKHGERRRQHLGIQFV